VSGICGWLGATDADPRAVLDDMRRRMTWTGAAVDCVEIGDGFGLAATGSAETIGTLALGPLRIAFHGHGLWRNGSARVLPPTEICAHIATAYIERGPDALTALAGDFALALLDLDKRQALLAIDRMGVRNLVYRVEHETVIFAANLDALAAHPLVAHRIDPQALYNYVYFHMVPGPGTIFDESRRLLAGHYALLREGKADVTRYWQMRFDESTAFDERELEDRFRSTLRAGVEARAVANACGTFLSGGTDSSTVTGMLSEVTGVPVGTYSIGFDASGYDEMDYARIAAKHFRTEHHEYYVTPADVMTAIPLLAAEYDQPFGNASDLLLRQARTRNRGGPHAGRRRRRRVVRRQRTLRPAVSPFALRAPARLAPHRHDRAPRAHPSGGKTFRSAQRQVIHRTGEPADARTLRVLQPSRAPRPR